MHPLDGLEFRFPNFKGFGNQQETWAKFAPISVLVGRNNSGKSAVIDALDVVLSGGKSAKEEYKRYGKAFSIEVAQKLTADELQRVFRDNVSSGGVPGHSHWEFGKRFIGHSLVRAFGADWQPSWVSGPDFSGIHSDAQARFRGELAKAAALPRASLFRIAAERNVRPEPESDPVGVAPDGQGLTNIIRAFLHDSRYPMTEVEVGLREI